MAKRTPASETAFLQAVDRRAEATIRAAGFTEMRLKSAPSMEFMIRHCSGILEATIQALAARDAQIADLTKRLDALEAGGIKYCGVWQRAASYAKGSIVTDGGSAWVALKNTEDGDKPGDASSWQLMVKAGRNGRDVPAP
ncbi:transposase [Sinorhizobium medicae]|uniref:transposase n=1 Tax=Sinorhizobium medicae TaxID=110321 RepID=UPI000FDAAAD7|nr:transposase [Sinorhizobium medicae]MDX0415211.1 transposase [Sinorhizobium medicae]MDX0446285.1 transposase [Sinorhizobium medicae]MDX0476304.1 transposase [Sinorhizobium medicae]MDX0659948.1 transposase [Sinorhizobium medicae]MDX1055050.1 transposase [Sinorhizobium medicae]